MSDQTGPDNFPQSDWYGVTNKSADYLLAGLAAWGNEFVVRRKTLENRSFT